MYQPFLIVNAIFVLDFETIDRNFPTVKIIFTIFEIVDFKKFFCVYSWMQFLHSILRNCIGTRFLKILSRLKVSAAFTRECNFWDDRSQLCNGENNFYDFHEIVDFKKSFPSISRVTVYAAISQPVSLGLALRSRQAYDSCTARLSSSKERVVQTRRATPVQLGV